MIYALVIGGAAVEAMMLWAVVTWRGRRTSPLMKQLVRVHTRDDRTLEGVLVAAYPASLVLRHAKLLEADTALSGDIVVERANVSFMQEAPPPPLPQPTALPAIRPSGVAAG